MPETNEIKAVRRGMTLMPRWHVLPNQQRLWRDLLVQSGVGEWVLYDDLKKHYDIIVAIISRAHARADEAEARAERLVENYATIKREYDEYVSLCDEQASRIRQLEARALRESSGNTRSQTTL